jgi:Flp pilus assembly protein TadD
VPEAIVHYRRALERGTSRAHNNLGVALNAMGRFDERLFREEALRLQPNIPTAILFH